MAKLPIEFAIATPGAKAAMHDFAEVERAMEKLQKRERQMAAESVARERLGMKDAGGGMAGIGKMTAKVFSAGIWEAAGQKTAHAMQELGAAIEGLESGSLNTAQAITKMAGGLPVIGGYVKAMEEGMNILARQLNKTGRVVNAGLEARSQHEATKYADDTDYFGLTKASANRTALLGLKSMSLIKEQGRQRIEEMQTGLDEVLGKIARDEIAPGMNIAAQEYSAQLKSEIDTFAAENLKKQLDESNKLVWSTMAKAMKQLTFSNETPSEREYKAAMEKDIARMTQQNLLVDAQAMKDNAMRDLIAEAVKGMAGGVGAAPVFSGGLAPGFDSRFLTGAAQASSEKMSIEEANGRKLDKSNELLAKIATVMTTMAQKMVPVSLFNGF